MKNKNCVICDSPVSGRTDKKYCSDHCRALGNNQNKILADEPILSVNKILRRNRTILKTLCPAGKATVRKEVLTAMGFNFSYFTTIFTTSAKQVYYLSYDFAFTPLMENDTEKVLIVSRQQYMPSWNPWQYLKKRTA